MVNKHHQIQTSWTADVYSYLHYIKFYLTKSKIMLCLSIFLLTLSYLLQARIRAGATTLIGGCIFIYSGSARLVSFEINLA